MGILADQRPVKLIASIIFRDEKSRQYAEERLKKAYGETEPLEKTAPFDRTEYYYEEFGRPLKRKIICFKKLFSKEDIGRIKLETNSMEDLSMAGEKRTVNIDPGYVTEAKLVLLTTKDYTHRVYVGERIFAESTLFYQEGTFRPWPWTYPDYASEELIGYFNEVRDLYMNDIKKGGR
jgi:hypothetical protein